LLAALFLVIGTAKAQAQEQAVPLDQIPKKVMDSLTARFPKSKIEKCTKAKEGEDIVYDIEFKQENGRKGEADIKEDGTYINFEVQIDAKDLPKVVKDGIEAKYPKSVMKEIMQETEVKGKEEKLSAYEVIIETADKKTFELRMSLDGKILEE